MCYHKDKFGNKSFDVNMPLGKEKRRKKMFNWYDRVRIKSSGIPGNIVDIYDDNGKSVPHYTVEIDDEYKVGELPKDLVLCEEDEIELVGKFE